MFWTPEQLSVLNATNVDSLCLAGSYGTGKTLLLIERAKTLLQDERNAVSLFIENSSGKKHLQEVVEKIFSGVNNIKVESIDLSDLQDFSNEKLIKYCGERSDIWNHFIIDECPIFSSESLMNDLKNLQSKCQSIWIALCSHDFDHLHDQKCVLWSNNFSCIFLQQSLRNGTKISNFAEKFVWKKFNFCSRNFKNSGYLYEGKSACKNLEDALQKALGKIPETQICLVFVNGPTDFSLVNLKKTPKIIDYFDEKLRVKWITSMKRDAHLLYHSGDGKEFSGMEFDCVVHVHPKCEACEKEEIDPWILLRAKSSLIVSKYLKLCNDCIGND